MALLDLITQVFGNDKKTKVKLDALKDGKLDMNDVKNILLSEADSNGDGKLDISDLDINQDGKTDLKDLEHAKKKVKSATDIIPKSTTKK